MTLGFDLELRSIVAPLGVSCPDIEITPKVIVKNIATEQISSFNITTQIDNGVIRRKVFRNVIQPGEEMQVSLDPIQVPNSEYDFNVVAELDNDENPDNNAQSQTIQVMDIRSLPLNEDFEGFEFNPTTNGLTNINYDNDDVQWDQGSVSAYGVGRKCARFDNYDESLGGTKDALVLPPLDFTTINNGILKFDVAYARYNPSVAIFDDSLQIIVSADCGVNYFTEIFNAHGSEYETGQPVTIPYLPGANEWKSYELDLQAFSGAASIMVAFVNISGGGNRLYLDNINIEENCQLTFEVDTQDLLCADNCTGLAAVNVSNSSGTLTYQWSTGATSAQATSLCAGDYQVTVTDGSCNSVVEFSIVAPESIMLEVSTLHETTFNAGDGSAFASVQGGTGNYTYAWSNGSHTNVVNNLIPGDYSLTVSDANNCQVVKSFQISAYQCSSIGLSVQHQNISCFGAADGSASASVGDGVAVASINWSTGASGLQVDQLTPGNYSVSITDDFNCQEVFSFSITEPTALSISLSANNITQAGAMDGSANATISGGTSEYNYLWSNGATSASISNLGAGSYSVTATDANGCTITESVEIQAVNCTGFGVSLNEIQRISCPEACDGMLQVNPTNHQGEWTATWSNGQTGATLNGLCKGDYMVTVTDSRNCQVVEFITVSDPQTITLQTASEAETGFERKDGKASVTAFGGAGFYTYAWSSGANTASVEGLAPGIYSVSVTDENGCIVEQSVTIEAYICNATIPEVELKPSECSGDCSGAAAVVLPDGAEGYSFLWSDGQTTQLVDGLCIGAYHVDVTDVNNCTIRKNIVITEPDPLDTVVETQNETALNAQDGQAQASASGGLGTYTYLWSNGFRGETQNNLSPGSYGLTVTDGNGCTAVKSFIIAPFVCPSSQ